MAAEVSDAEKNLLAAMMLFQLGRVSTGAGAKMAGITRMEFIEKLGEHGIPVLQQTSEELRAELVAVGRPARS